MATLKFYLDKRYTKWDGTCSLKLSVAHQRKQRYLNLGINLEPEQWDPEEECVRPETRRDSKQLNRQLARLFLEAQEACDVVEKGRCSASLIVEDYVQAIEARWNGEAIVLAPRKEATVRRRSNPNTFEKCLLRHAAKKAPGTQALYRCTLSRMRAFWPGMDTLRFEDINKDWLERFDAFLAVSAPSKNGRNVHLRNIRAVFNYAIDEEVTQVYPFRRFKIRAVATRKRSLSVERLREFFAAEVEPYAQQYLDMFKLIFMLCGINTVDLCRLKGIYDGRIEYRRAKTGRLYSVKVEPEAMEIINRYRGRGQLLDMLDRYNSPAYFTQHINKALQRIGGMERKGRGGKKYFTPLCPGITTYWARHSWATIAASLDIPKETIAAGLGHGGNTVTDIYIDFDQKKVDDANRRVLDWVLYEKK